VTGASIFAGKIYNNPVFKAAMNVHYADVNAMRTSLKTLQNSGQIDVATMQFGQYQPILAPNNTGGAWLREMGFARVQLSAQPNATAVSNDQPGVIPLTKCDLLDACVRKCFNSEPPIPMTIDVTDKNANSPDPDLHDIILTWDYGKDGIPTRLHLTMVCPYRS
jgi:hypothetical protein